MMLDASRCEYLKKLISWCNDSRQRISNIFFLQHIYFAGIIILLGSSQLMADSFFPPEGELHLPNVSPEIKEIHGTFTLKSSGSGFDSFRNSITRNISSNGTLIYKRRSNSIGELTEWFDLQPAMATINSELIYRDEAECAPGKTQALYSLKYHNTSYLPFIAFNLHKSEDEKMLYAYLSFWGDFEGSCTTKHECLNEEVICDGLPPAMFEVVVATSEDGKWSAEDSFSYDGPAPIGSIYSNSITSTFTSVGVPTTATLTWDIPLIDKQRSDDKISCASAVSNSSVIACENQSLGEDIDIAGTPFQLHYQSDRVPGRLDANSLIVTRARELGGWFLDIQHVYDPSANVLYLGNGEQRDAIALGTVKSQNDGGFLISSVNASEVYVFDRTGLHLRTTQVLTGKSVYEFLYDSQQRLQNVKDADGNITTIERNTNGDPHAIIGPFGQRTMLAVDSNGYLISIIDPVGQAVKLSSTESGLLTSFTNALNFTSTYQYDTNGRLFLANNAAGGFQQLSRVDNPDGGRTINRSTAEGRGAVYQVIKSTPGGEDRVITNEAGLTTFSSRTAEDVSSVKLPNGVLTSRTVAPDARFGRSAPIINSSTVTMPSGLTQNISETREIILADPSNPLTLTDLTNKINLNGRIYESRYQALNKTFTRKTPFGRESTVTLDDNGRVAKEKMSGLLPTYFSYDDHGRLVNIIQGKREQARTIHLSYDNFGFIDRIIDPVGRKINFVNDALGRVTQIILPDNRAIGYSYDGNSNITALIPPERPAHIFTYNKLDMLSTYSAPNVGSESNQTKYTYNLDGQLIQLIYPDGSTMNLNYDLGGRISTVDFPRGTISYEYGPRTGQLNSVNAPGNINLAYDYDGDLLIEETWIGPISGSVQHDYDNDFRVKGIQVNDAYAVDISYDKDGLPVRIGDLSLIYNPKNGLLESTILGQIKDNWTYNGFGEPLTYKAFYDNSLLLSVNYTRDRLGRIVQKTETIDGVETVYSYSYDLVGRLMDVRKNGSVLSSYTYDSNGNRLSLTNSAGTFTGLYNAQDWMTQYGNTTYTFAANGNLRNKSISSKMTIYQYDTLGNLTDVTLPDGNHIEYLIDGKSRRIGKKVNGVKGQGFLYQSALRPAAELDSNNNIVSRFVYATRDNVPEYIIKSGVTFRILTDHLGSPRLVINTVTGTIAQRMDYDEFGNVTNDTNPGFQPFGFAGGLYDGDTKLVRFATRDYDAETGRWTTKDPILFNGGQENLYIYAENDPVNREDVHGLDSNWLKWVKDLWDGRSKESRFKKLNKIDKGIKREVGKEYTKLIKEDEKLAKEAVDPFSKKLRDLWTNCSDALAGKTDSDDPTSLKPMKKIPLQELPPYRPYNQQEDY